MRTSKSKPKWTYQDVVKLAGGDLTVAGGQTEDDILHMASYIRDPDRCLDHTDSLARTSKVLNQELQLWPQPSVNLLKEHYEKSNLLSTDKQIDIDALKSCSNKILIYLVFFFIFLQTAIFSCPVSSIGTLNVWQICSLCCPLAAYQLQLVVVASVKWLNIWSVLILWGCGSCSAVVAD